MFVTIKNGKKKIKVAVANKDCPLYTCFTPDKSMPVEDNYYYCSFRNLRGCPDVKIKRNEKMREIYKVEYYDLKQLDWIPFSRHKNEYSAIICADVVSKSRKTRARVIFGRIIIHEKAP